jgi:hypothetical protein
MGKFTHKIMMLNFSFQRRYGLGKTFHNFSGVIDIAEIVTAVPLSPLK